MSKKTNCNKMLVNQLSSVLPDDRPITAINIVEDIDKCPANFTVVSDTEIRMSIINLYMLVLMVRLNDFDYCVNGIGFEDVRSRHRCGLMERIWAVH